MRQLYKDKTLKKWKPGAAERTEKENELRRKLNEVLKMIDAEYFVEQTWLMNAIIDSWWWTCKKKACGDVFGDTWQKEKYGKYYVKSRKAEKDFAAKRV